MRRELLAFGFFSLILVGTTDVRAERAIDRVAVRFISPETGGSAHPRFFTEREVAFYARTEAIIEQTAIEQGEYPDRYVRSAIDRLVARTMLARLAVSRGTEPPDFAKMTTDARAELADRLGGSHILADAMKKEGIEEEELLGFLRDQVRAAYYVDKAISPILTVTEEQLREAFRSALHPFPRTKFEDVRVRLRRWLVMERLRAAEVEFLQGARARIDIVSVIPPPSPVAK